MFWIHSCAKNRGWVDVWMRISTSSTHHIRYQINLLNWNSLPARHWIRDFRLLALFMSSEFPFPHKYTLYIYIHIYMYNHLSLAALYFITCLTFLFLYIMIYDLNNWTYSIVTPIKDNKRDLCWISSFYYYYFLNSIHLNNFLVSNTQSVFICFLVSIVSYFFFCRL